jgi:hypothetical protein
MVLKLDVPSLYLKINKVDNLWFDGLWTLGGITILFVSLMCGHQKCFFFNWKLIVKIKSCWSQYTKMCNMLVHFFNHLPDLWKESPDQKNKLSWYKRHEDPTVVSSNPADDGVYSIQHYVIQFVSDLRQIGGFFRVLRFPPPIKLTATI